ncbi:hypothetical protein QFZ99_004667 [Paraburkholderia atlantica]
MTVGMQDVPVGREKDDPGGEAIDDQLEALFLRAQRSFGLLTVLDVRVDSAPLYGLTGSIGNRTGSACEPAIRAIVATHSRFRLAPLAGGEDGSPGFDQPWLIVRMERRLPAFARRLLDGKPRIFAPASIDELDAAVRKGRPDQPGERIHRTTEFVFHRDPFLQRASRYNDRPLGNGSQYTLVSVRAGLR